MLVRNGHDATVLDYNTVEMMEHLVPSAFRSRLGEIYDFSNDSRQLLVSKAYRFAQLKILNALLERHRRKVVQRFATELVSLVEKTRVDWVGFKLWNGDGFEGAVTMAREIKRRNPKVKLFGGGPHAYIFKSLLLDYLPLDALSLDESEDTIVGLAEFAAGRRSLDDIPNIVFRSPDGIKATGFQKVTNLDALPFPDYSEPVYPSLYTGGKLRVGVIDESRGCLFSCPFCVQNCRQNNRFRAKSPHRIVDEIEAMNRDGYRLFRFGGQMTPGWLLEGVARELIARNLEVSFTCFGHVNCLKGVDFPMLRSAGLNCLFLGIETADEKLMARTIGVKCSPKVAEEAIVGARAAGIAVEVSIIHPLPFSDEATVQANLEFLRRTCPDAVAVYFPGIYPHTPWADKPAEYGFEITSKRFLEKIINYKTKHLFPPRFWAPLPYKVNGLPFKAFSRETERFAGLLKAGFSLYLTDVLFLVADAIGEAPSDFGARVKRALYCGDADTVRQVIAAVNN